jgi:hypothetical protein
VHRFRQGYRMGAEGQETAKTTLLINYIVEKDKLRVKPA